MDIEYRARKQVIAALSQWFELQEEADVALRDGGLGRVDVLGRPLDRTIGDISLAFEVKAPEVGKPSLGAWIKQGYDYVSSSPRNGWSPVVASILWFPGHVYAREGGGEPCVFQRMAVAGHFRVGRASIIMGQLDLSIGPDTFLRSGGGWTKRASVILNAKRQQAGSKKSLVTL